MLARTILKVRRRIVAAALLACSGALTLLRFCPPEQFSFYPRCPIHTLFGIECPGCGATHALSALMLGDVPAAMRDNAMFVVLLPFLIAFSTLAAWRAATREQFEWPQVSPHILYALTGTALGFGILRNLA